MKNGKEKTTNDVVGEMRGSSRTECMQATVEATRCH